MEQPIRCHKSQNLFGTLTQWHLPITLNRSNLLTNCAPLIWSIQSSIPNNGWQSGIVTAFTFQKSMQKCKLPSCFGSRIHGGFHWLWLGSTIQYLFNFFANILMFDRINSICMLLNWHCFSYIHMAALFCPEAPGNTWMNSCKIPLIMFFLGSGRCFSFWSRLFRISEFFKLVTSLSSSSLSGSSTDSYSLWLQVCCHPDPVYHGRASACRYDKAAWPFASLGYSRYNLLH